MIFWKLEVHGFFLQTCQQKKIKEYDGRRRGYWADAVERPGFSIVEVCIGDHHWSSFWFSNKQHYLSLA